jgi:phosphonopyruvate decarboxylase
MILCEELNHCFAEQGLQYFCGVPDSTFKEWMSFLADHHGHGLINRIASIERDAIALAAGYYVATGRLGVVYLQNSGLGNTVNPLTSLADELVYGIPMLLMIGWRGKPGEKDEPQHAKMGQVTTSLLDVLGIPWELLPATLPQAAHVVEKVGNQVLRSSSPAALVIPSGILAPYTSRRPPSAVAHEMRREEAIQAIVPLLAANSVLVATTGKTARELFEYRSRGNLGHDRDFLMVGAMGLAAVFSAELALQRPDRPVVVLDGDGALLMGSTGLFTIGHYRPRNLLHIVLDNASHDSTGGQPTTSPSADLRALALAVGYAQAFSVETKSELLHRLPMLISQDGPVMLIVKVATGSRPDLGRPTTTPVQNKQSFMRNLGSFV